MFRCDSGGVYAAFNKTIEPYVNGSEKHNNASHSEGACRFIEGGQWFSKTKHVINSATLDRNTVVSNAKPQ